MPSSITHGAADFLDELATKRSTTFSVVVSSQSVALILLLSLPFLSPASPTAIDIAWGATSGLGRRDRRGRDPAELVSPSSLSRSKLILSVDFLHVATRDDFFEDALIEQILNIELHYLGIAQSDDLLVVLKPPFTVILLDVSLRAHERAGRKGDPT
ncbi:MAG TPA: hypothetical protein VGK77_16505 [Candidatus Binatia bacterium]